MKAFIIAMLATVALSACSAVGNLLEAANGGISGLFVTQATVRYIERANGADARYERAQRVAEAASEIRAAAQGQVSIAALRELAYAKIPADYEVSDKILAAELITYVADELEQRLGSDPLPAEDLPNLDALLRRIEFAAAYFPKPA